MKLSEFDYKLPQEFIAQTPAEPRDYSKLMVIHRNTGFIEHKHFYDIADYLNEKDVLVANNSKVMAARLFGNKSTGAKVEILLLHKEIENRWQALVKPAKRLRIGDEIYFGVDKNYEIKQKDHGILRPPGARAQNDALRKGGIIVATVVKEMEEGIRALDFNCDIINKLDKIGIVPLPPYIKVADAQSFKKRYQTVYSKTLGSAAAPTAGLHFTDGLIEELKIKGVEFKYASLHIGLDTFRPMTAENIEEHKIHKEYCEFSEDLARELNRARKNGKRVVAVGTTTARILETACNKNGISHPFKGWTNIFIYPGYKFKAVDALITNFHLPKSSLLLMVSAFAGKKLITKAYEEAKKHNYRFFSFGDAMLIM
ncbi:MAG: tRNA preQ1(34) S-adenosylmethionine ribosyltransferase-isomerase QueA [bacterium]